MNSLLQQSISRARRTIPLLHERPAIMDQIQIDQLFFEIFLGRLIKTRAHFG